MVLLGIQYTKHCSSGKELEDQNLSLWRKLHIYRCALSGSLPTALGTRRRPCIICINWYYLHQLVLSASIGIICINWYYLHQLVLSASIGIVCINWHYLHQLVLSASIGVICINWHYLHQLALSESSNPRSAMRCHVMVQKSKGAMVEVLIEGKLCYQTDEMHSVKIPVSKETWEV